MPNDKSRAKRGAVDFAGLFAPSFSKRHQPSVPPAVTRKQLTTQQSTSPTVLSANAASVPTAIDLASYLVRTGTSSSQLDTQAPLSLEHAIASSPAMQAPAKKRRNKPARHAQQYTSVPASASIQDDNVVTCNTPTSSSASTADTLSKQPHTYPQLQLRGDLLLQQTQWNKLFPH